MSASLGSEPEGTEVSEHPLTLDVGDVVVYGSHGVGTVTRRNVSPTGAGGAASLVVEFANGLAITLSAERAATCLRSLSGPAELASVRRILRTAGSVEESWRLRTKAAKSKILAGEMLGLAEVVSDSERLIAQTSAAGGPRQLSMHERGLYLKARELLAAEIGRILGVRDVDADAWIGDQLEQSSSTPPTQLVSDARIG